MPFELSLRKILLQVSKHTYFRSISIFGFYRRHLLYRGLGYREANGPELYHIEHCKDPHCRWGKGTRSMCVRKRVSLADLDQSMSDGDHSTRSALCRTTPVSRRSSCDDQSRISWAFSSDSGRPRRSSNVSSVVKITRIHRPKTRGNSSSRVNSSKPFSAPQRENIRMVRTSIGSHSSKSIARRHASSRIHDNSDRNPDYAVSNKHHVQVDHIQLSSRKINSHRSKTAGSNTIVPLDDSSRVRSSVSVEHVPRSKLAFEKSPSSLQWRSVDQFSSPVINSCNYCSWIITIMTTSSSWKGPVGVSRLL